MSACRASRSMRGGELKNGEDMHGRRERERAFSIPSSSTIFISHVWTPRVVPYSSLPLTFALVVARRRRQRARPTATTQRAAASSWSNVNPRLPPRSRTPLTRSSNVHLRHTLAHNVCAQPQSNSIYLTDSRSIKIPFASPKHAEIAKSVVQVDAELQPHSVRRTLSVERSTLIACVPCNPSFSSSHPIANSRHAQSDSPASPPIPFSRTSISSSAPSVNSVKRQSEQQAQNNSTITRYSRYHEYRWVMYPLHFLNDVLGFAFLRSLLDSFLLLLWLPQRLANQRLQLLIFQLLLSLHQRRLIPHRRVGNERRSIR